MTGLVVVEIMDSRFQAQLYDIIEPVKAYPLSFPMSWEMLPNVPGKNWLSICEMSLFGTGSMNHKMSQLEQSCRVDR